MEFKTKDSVVVIVPAESHQTVAFTNGIYNPDGGVHVDAWASAIFKPLIAKFNKPGKPQIKINDVKQHFLMIVKCDLPNPEFTSQSKTCLASPKPETKVTTKQINSIMKCRLFYEWFVFFYKHFWPGGRDVLFSLYFSVGEIRKKL